MTRAHRRPAGRSRIVSHANFGHSETKISRLCQNLCIYEELPGLDSNLIEDFPTEKFECAIDISNSNSKYDSHQEIETPGQDQSSQRIKSIDSEAIDNIRILNERQQICNFTYIKLVVRVSIKDQLIPGICEACFERFGITAVRIVMKDSDVRRILGSQSISYLRCSIYRTIGYNNDLPVAKAERSKYVSNPLRGCLDVFFFVVSREDR